MKQILDHSSSYKSLIGYIKPKKYNLELIRGMMDNKFPEFFNLNKEIYDIKNDIHRDIYE